MTTTLQSCPMGICSFYFIEIVACVSSGQIIKAGLLDLGRWIVVVATALLRNSHVKPNAHAPLCLPTPCNFSLARWDLPVSASNALDLPLGVRHRAFSNAADLRGRD